MLDCVLAICLAVARRFDYFPPEPERTTLTFAFTGDNKLAGRTARQIAQHGEAYPYAAVTDVLAAADIAFGNLECPITDHAFPTAGKSAESIAAGENFVFKASPASSARILAGAGYDVLSLANNHMLDYQGAGLAQTQTELAAHELVGVGAGPDNVAAATPVFIERDGLTAAYLAYSLIVPPQSKAGPGTPGINTLPQLYAPALERAIAPLKDKADIVVCSFHWGTESKPVPEKYQRDIARAAIDAGASLVIGHHPHCLQGFEFYHGGLIAYSLGNFVFTGPSRKQASCILEVEAGRDGITAARLLPVWLTDGRPAPAADAKLLAQIKQVCQGCAVQLTARADGWVELVPVAEAAAPAPASTQSAAQAEPTPATIPGA
jgi:poly-gamma-glutamate capsule biosynthesis protein CapA/YwtB (metallophosphatase superfamily)